jgi:hypothetical protein
MSYLNTGIKQFIAKKDNTRGLLALSDRSLWKVSLFDKSTVLLWLPMDDVVVGEGILNTYKITHVKRKETIEAELVQK